jgi:hypothetical protein
VAVTPYLVLAAVSGGMLPWSWHRSRHWARYRWGTGAPVVWALLLLTAGVCLTLVLLGEPILARELGLGGLIGSGLALSILVRNSDSRFGEE